MALILQGQFVEAVEVVQRPPKLSTRLHGSVARTKRWKHKTGSRRRLLAWQLRQATNDRVGKHQFGHQCANSSTLSEAALLMRTSACRAVPLRLNA